MATNVVDKNVRRMDARITRLFRGGDVVIDLGCGDGAKLEDCGHLYRRAIGVDINTERLHRRYVAREQHEGWTFILSDLDEGIPVASGVVDAVHANQVIEHVRNPLYFAIEVLRVLRPGGVLVVTTPNVRYLPHIWSLVVEGSGPATSGNRSKTVTDWDGGHIHFFTPLDLVWIARQAGFSQVKTSALVDLSGRFRSIRRILNAAAETPPVKQFLSGNTLMVARK